MQTNNNFDKVYPVLLAGGSGTRLWPVSRQHAPKQLCKLFGADSLLQLTVKRLQPMLAASRVRVVCGHEHALAVQRDLAEVGIDPDKKIISEPCGRNTAPAVLLMLSLLMRKDPEAIVCILPADHMISKSDNFHEDLQLAIEAARQGHIVTFGIPPTYPETGYGYVESGVAAGSRVFRVKRFVEKPDYDTALGYLHAGNYYWNSGMFVFKAKVMWHEFERLAPELFAAMSNIALNDSGLADSAVYENLPNISIDYAIMEKTDLAVVIPAQFLWSDIGSWKSLYDFMPKDHLQNYAAGDVMALNTQRSLLLNSDGPLVVTNHLRDVIVVATRDAVFVSDMHHSQDVKDVVGDLKQLGRNEAVQPFCNNHDFGRMWTLEDAGSHLLVRLDIWSGHKFALWKGLASSSRILCLSGRGVLCSAGREADLRPGTSVMGVWPGDVVNDSPDKLELLIFMQMDTRFSDV